MVILVCPYLYLYIHNCHYHLLLLLLIKCPLIYQNVTIGLWWQLTQYQSSDCLRTVLPTWRYDSWRSQHFFVFGTRFWATWYTHFVGVLAIVTAAVIGDLIDQVPEKTVYDKIKAAVTRSKLFSNEKRLQQLLTLAINNYLN